MRKFFIVTIILSFLALPAQAETKPAHDVVLKVSGLVCDFCAQAIEKVFLKQDSVKAVTVDLDNGKVTVDLKPGKTIDDQTLNKLMTDSGYTVTGIERKPKEKS